MQKKIFALTEQLHKINDSLAQVRYLHVMHFGLDSEPLTRCVWPCVLKPAQKVAARNDYDSTIQETEAAYMKILESSQTLLHVLKRETVNLSQRKPFGSPVRGPSDDRSQYMAGQGQMHSQLGHRLLHEDS